MLNSRNRELRCNKAKIKDPFDYNIVFIRLRNCKRTLILCKSFSRSMSRTSDVRVPIPRFHHELTEVAGNLVVCRGRWLRKNCRSDNHFLCIPTVFSPEYMLVPSRFSTSDVDGTNRTVRCARCAGDMVAMLPRGNVCLILVLLGKNECARFACQDSVCVDALWFRTRSFGKDVWVI